MATEKYKRYTKNAGAPGGFMEKGEPKGAFLSRRQGTSNGYMAKRGLSQEAKSIISTNAKAAKEKVGPEAFAVQRAELKNADKKAKGRGEFTGVRRGNK